MYEELEKRGYELWIDKYTMIVGNTDELMKNGIDNSQLFVCCATTIYSLIVASLNLITQLIRKRKLFISYLNNLMDMMIE